MISVFWPWLFSSRIYQAVRLTVNFYPSLLPINRGWFPHVHSLVDGSASGVTPHQIEAGADTGVIWVQKIVLHRPTDTA